MSCYLPDPSVEKDTATTENCLVKVGTSRMQGWRPTMEDRHRYILSLPTDQEASFFAVYDGHGGVDAANHAANTLHKVITRRAEYASGDIPTAIREGFLEFDHMLRDLLVGPDNTAGSTAVILLIKDNTLYCGNLGDSRAVACVGGVHRPLSYDHRPNNPEEHDRIVAADGFVKDGRVKGLLALSRALGDFAYKSNPFKTARKQMVIALPDVHVEPVIPNLEFVILACDGIWDCISSAECIKFIRKRLAMQMKPEVICEELMSLCLAPCITRGGRGCDNMTLIILCFLQGKTWEEYCFKIKETQPARKASVAGASRRSVKAGKGNDNAQPKQNDNEAEEGVDEEQGAAALARKP